MSWEDPTQDILAGIRDIIFRSAIAGTNASIQQAAHATETLTQAVYMSHYAYLAAALAVTFIAVCVLITLFFGWDKLGRNISLSPIEIAKAFNASLLDGSDSNGDVKALLRQVGRREVQYREAIDKVKISRDLIPAFTNPQTVTEVKSEVSRGRSRGRLLDQLALT
jgi:hypothetical protein